MPANDMRAEQRPPFAGRLDGYGAGPEWRPAIVDQRASQTFDGSLLVPQHVRWKLSAEELFDPVDQANCGERISAERKEIILHSNRRYVEDSFPDSHQLHFHCVPRGNAGLLGNLELDVGDR